MSKQKSGSVFKVIMIFIGLVVVVFALLMALIYVIPETHIFQFDKDTVSY